MKSIFQLPQVLTRDPRRGAAATEAAVVLPIMMTLAFGAVDFGRVFGLAVEMANAVQAGAELGATNRPSTLAYTTWISNVQTAVINELSDQNDFDMSKVTVSVNLSTDSQGNQQVQVTANYVFKTIVSWPFIPTQVPLQYQMTMRQYR